MPLARKRLFEGGAKHTQVVVDALVEEAGELVVYGHDLGATPEDPEMRLEEEYEIRVGDTARMLLELLADRFGDDPAVVEDLREWLDERGIPYESGA